MDMMLPVGVGGCLPAASGGLLPVSDTAGLVSTSPVDAQTNETHDSPIKNEEDAPESVPVQEAPSEKITYRIPSYAEWFSSDKIHFIERRALPEFFDGKSLSRTPKVYKESRDFIINKYKEQPERALTYTEIRKMLVGDVNLIRKIFDYVEYWGLINFHTANENKQKEIGTESGAVQFPTETIPSGIRIVYPSKILRAKAQKPSKEGPSGIINMPSYMDIFTNSNLLNVTGSELTAITGSQICSNCGIDNQSKWFENREKEGSILCEACFTAGDKFLKEDFTLVESVGGSKRNSVWTKEEVLSLLEAIATHGNNWDDVASKVGTKSKAECIMYFMKLPFGDQFCNGNVEPDSLITSRSTTDSLKIDQRNTNNNVEFVGVHDNEELLESVEDAEGPPNKARRLNPLADSSHPILDQVRLLSCLLWWGHVLLLLQHMHLCWLFQKRILLLLSSCLQLSLVKRNQYKLLQPARITQK
ncbi:hypothetical protein KP509_18G048000 [Ceratopteris richardii]|uniref:Uncharacterized protein n=1 Tax=Ceratopteris richardii TaxID=49495 RepID=A0A8T2SRE2_CERRI|nr:hypothetical protein KP509_18G048000 [Ceratopteris richardii]